MKISDIPGMKDPRNRLIIAIAAGLVLVLIVVGIWAALGASRQVNRPSTDPKSDQKTVASKHEEDMRRGSDGGLTFSFDVNDVRIQVPQISDGSPVARTPRENMQFATVVLHVRNATDSQKSLYTSEQVLVTTSGKRVTADAGLQFYVADGDWYEFIPADSTTSGLLVFEIGAEERIDSFEFHGGLDTKGTVLRFSNQPPAPEVDKQDQKSQSTEPANQKKS